MATYSFSCSLCKHIFDESIPIHKYAEMDKKKVKFRCPSCNKLMNPKRVLSTPTVVFVGEGFYVNDTRKKDEDRGTG